MTNYEKDKLTINSFVWKIIHEQTYSNVIVILQDNQSGLICLTFIVTRSDRNTA